MDTAQAMLLGAANRHKAPRVFDWDKAAKLIKETNPTYASAGLRGDWEWTGGTIFEDGVPVMDDYTYLSSTWAIPEIVLDGVTLPCFVDGPTEWDHSTKWPRSSLKILLSQTSQDSTS